jgi:hypothetical protein
MLRAAAGRATFLQRSARGKHPRLFQKCDEDRVMAMIVRAAGGVPGIPGGFPILFNNQMAIIEAAFAYLIEHATVLGRSRAVETVRTYAEHLHD